MILTTNTPYPTRKVWRIRAYTQQRPQRKEDQYAISREDQYAVLDIWHVNILEDIKRGPYSKKHQYAISNPLDTPMDDLNITIEDYIRLEEEKDQKCGKVFIWETAKNGKIWYDEDIQDLRTVETKFPAIPFNDGVSSEKTLSCKPTVSSLNDEIDFRILFDDSDDEDYTPVISCFDDLDFFKDFENGFPTIVYNNAQTYKSNLLTESILSPQHIDEFDLNDKTSLSEYDEDEQNVLYFNDLFPFNIIHPNDLKSKKDNDDNKFDIIQSSGNMAPLPPREQRHSFLRYQGLEYIDADIADFEERLFETRGPLVWELILEFLSTLRFVEVLLDLDAPDTIRFQLGRARRCLRWRQFILALGLHTREEIESPSFARDPVLRLCHRMMVHSIAGRSQAPEKGLTVISHALPFIDMAKLVRLQICMKIDDTWAWVALGPKRQPDAAAGTPKATEDAPVVDEGGQADPAPMQAPQ
ncbi:hypothetical protein Tco_0016963 [Tanacetum coccineum]